MRLTVGVCTWNRSSLLRQALEQMTRLLIPPGVDWELLIVNNNSTDATDEVIDSYSTALPLRRLFEPKPGKSNALNLAVREAHGDYILWTDDDALVDENWLNAYVRAIQQHPVAVFFGGPVQPWFASPPPLWLKRAWPRVASAYATRDLGAQPVPFNGGDHVPYGVNWAVRLKEQRHFLYDLRLGPPPGNRNRGEDTTLINELLANGYEGWWVPEAGVKHYIPPERITIAYLRSWYLRYGEYLAMKEPPWKGPTLFGKPRWLWRQAVGSEVKYRFRRLSAPPEIWIQYLIAASTAWGWLTTRKV